MLYEKKIVSMSDGNKNVFHSWVPDSESDIKMVMLLSHGMAEYVARYDRFASVLCANGIALFAEDHRGHGETADLAEREGTGKFGYITEKNGFLRVVEDIHEEIFLLKNRFPEKKIVLFGHSFGSFVSQCVIEKYGDLLDGCILCGTAGPRPLLIGLAKILGSVVCCLRGAKNKSKFLDGLSFGSYGKKIKNPKTEFDWLSRDEKNVELYVNHPWCGFVCTGEFYKEMFKGLSMIHKKSMISAIPKNLPVYFIDGKEDPVGDYGKTVEKLFQLYKKNGMKDVELKFYEGARHELLNETNKSEVDQGIIKWISSRFFVKS